MKTILDVLSAWHPEDDVSINAERLIPHHGWLVEYEHWSATSSVQCRVAFLQMIDHRGGLTVAWSNFTHEKKEHVRLLRDRTPAKQPECPLCVAGMPHLYPIPAKVDGKDAWIILPARMFDQVVLNSKLKPEELYAGAHQAKLGPFEVVGDADKWFWKAVGIHGEQGPYLSSKDAYVAAMRELG